MEQDHVPNADTSGARAPERRQNSTGLRSWALTIGIAGAMLLTMYGLAFWHEARGQAARASTTQSTPLTGTPAATSPAEAPHR